MSKKLIEVEQEYLIECDHCEYKIMNVEGGPSDISAYINRPCPWCRQNLLTEKDYRTYVRVTRLINWVNRWFSWLTFFRRGKNYSEKTISMKVHDGVTIKATRIENDIPGTFSAAQAMLMMQQGHKVTHRYFTFDEWVMLKPGDPGKVLFEDGVEMSRIQFWEERQNEMWQIHWALWPVKK